VTHNTTYRRLAWLGLVFLASALGCSDDAMAPDLMGQAWRLRLNHHAVTLSTTAPYNTIQLQSVVTDVNGDTIHDAPAPIYTTTSGNVTIDSTGLVTGLLTQTGAKIIAKVQYKNATVRDTVVVNIVNNPNPPTSATLTLGTQTPGDSAVLYILDLFGGAKILKATVFDGDTHPVSGVAVRYYSADTMMVKISQSGSITIGSALAPGNVMVYAEATVFGIDVQDSMQVRIPGAKMASVVVVFRTPKERPTAVGYFTPDTVHVVLGGVVFWTNNSFEPIDVTFDDPSAALAWPFYPDVDGNIAVVAADSADPNAYQRVRMFMTAGTYPFHSTKYGTSGVVVVDP
jgi:hypothetical protein